MLGLVPLHLTLYTIHQNAAPPQKKYGNRNANTTLRQCKDTRCLG